MHRLVPFAVLMIGNLWLASQARAGTIIDSFDTVQLVRRTGIGTSSGTADVTAGTIIGNERDVVVTVTAGGGTLSADASLSLTGGFSHAAGGGVKGTTLITYDGNDDDATTLNPTGLSGVDLTSGGRDNLVYVLVPFADLGASLIVTVYTDANNCSALSKPIPAGIVAGALATGLLFRFSDFVRGPACSGPATFANVGAITLLIDGTAVGATDVTIDLFTTGFADFGDLPPAFHNTTLADNGAAHVICGLPKLGNAIDGENDGQESANATGDDTNGTPDDEDGVVLTPGFLWSVGNPSANGGKVDVTVMGDGCLSAWIDFNGDNDFGDAGENVLNNVAVTTGTATYSFSVPVGATFPNNYFARFRLYPRDDPNGANNCTSPRQPILPVECGEVEDYLLPVNKPPVCGNQIIEAGEQCDDGNLVDGDGCDSNCTPTGCGNGIVTAGEQCDDGNLVDMDGCDANCTLSFCNLIGSPSAHLIPGYCGHRRNDCLHEFCTDAKPSFDLISGLPGNRIRCRDGDPTCDAGPAGDHACVFRMKFCFNVTDRRFSCPSNSGEIEAVSVPARKNGTDAISLANREAAEAALVAIGGTLETGASVPGLRAVHFKPPLGSTNVCTPAVDITVPLLRRGAGFVKHKKRFVLMTYPPRAPGHTGWTHFDGDHLKLECDP